MEDVVNGPGWTDRSVLVTGATGLLGGWLVRSLLERRAQVVCVVRDGVPNSMFGLDGMIDQVATCRGDVCDLGFLDRVLAEYEVQTVFHLAAQTIVTIANRNPLSTFETNVAGTWRLLDACRRCATVGEVVIASSDKAYGEQDDLPYAETSPLEGRNPYDVSKSCADLIAQSFAHTWGVPVAITRCGNFFGGGDLNFNRLIPGTIREVLAGRPPVVRSDGKMVRDYLYAEDGADAYILLAEQMRSRPELLGRAYNFSLGAPMTVLDMVTRVTGLLGSQLEPVVLDEAQHEIPAQYLDASRARAELGWSPAVGLDEGLRRTIGWYRNLFGRSP